MTADIHPEILRFAKTDPDELAAAVIRLGSAASDMHLDCTDPAIPVDWSLRVEWQAGDLMRRVAANLDEYRPVSPHYAGHEQVLQRREAIVDGLPGFKGRTLHEWTEDVRIGATALSFLQQAHPSLHVRQCLSNPQLWTYFASPEHARAGRRTQTRPARLLTKFQADIQAQDVCAWSPPIPDDYAAWAAEVANAWRLYNEPPTCHWAEDGEDMARVYIHGPSSCMSGRLTDPHPATVYDTPDIGLAYAVKGGRIVARALVNKLEQEYSRIYGNKDALAPWLREQGLSSGGCMYGCRLLRVEDNYGALIGPYLDGEQGIEVVSSLYLRVTRSGRGDYQADSTSGYLSDEDVGECHECGERHHREDLTYIESCDHEVCDGCLDYHYAYAVTSRYRKWNNSDWVRNEEVVGEYQGSAYTEEGADACGLVVVQGELYSEDDVVYCADSGEYITADDAEQCAHDGDHYHNQYMVDAPDGERVNEDNLEDYIKANNLDDDEDAMEAAA